MKMLRMIYSGSLCVATYTKELSLDDVDENRSIDSICLTVLTFVHYTTTERGGKWEWPKPHNL